jgi:hypothetical protein
MISGECFCGEIRYEIDGSLVDARACHCSRCRKVFSGASSAFAEISDPDKFRWVTGEAQLKQYTSKQGWGLGFCSNCGSTLCGLFQGKVKGVTLGTVNGDPGIEISAHIFVDSKAPWDHIGGGAPQYPEWPA